MKLSTTIKFASNHAGIEMDLVLEAERLGFDAVWAGEAYGTDAVSPVAWVLARTSRIKAGTSIMQMPARTPACAAMTAMTLQALSGNRFLCGIGPSGPQVVEGWHGVPFGKPLARTREYVRIIRQVLAREGPLEHHGEHYDIPYAGPGSTGLAKPLRSIIHGDPSLKIYTASISPAGLRTAGEFADGVLPYFMSPEKAAAIVGPIRDGRARAGKSPDLANFDNAPYVQYGMAEGTVRIVSPDSFTAQDEARNPTSAVPLPTNSDPFYRARIAIDRVAVHDVPGGFRVTPGMPVTADIKVGKRTVLTYLLGRMMPLAQEGMREP